MELMKRKFVLAHMEAAHVYAKLSTCERRKVGALFTKYNSPLAIGYNGTKPGTCNCCEDANGNTKSDVRHAEINGLNKFWSLQETARDSVLFVTDSPCADCIKDLIYAGVSCIFYDREYRDTDPIIEGKVAGIRFYRVTEGKIYDVSVISRMHKIENSPYFRSDRTLVLRENTEESLPTSKVQWDLITAGSFFGG